MAFEQFEVVDAATALDGFTSNLFKPNIGQKLRELLFSFSNGAKSAVIENHYIDIDYSASYYEQRGRSFTPENRATTRIHFFSDHFSKDDLVAADPAIVQKMQSTYLGFTVVRPEDPGTLGRTFISCPDSVNGNPATFPTRGRTSVDLAGIPLEIEACPYMSQDRKIMACATAAIWMTVTPLAEKIPEITAHTTAEITGAAMSLDRPYGPAVGRRGLTLTETEQALLEIGLDPRIHRYPPPDRLVEICHLFSDSGIPPILSIESDGIGHAVTVVGYTLRPTAATQPTNLDICPAHHFVADLIIHDDERGMYLPAEVYDPPQGSNALSALRIKRPDRNDEALCKAILVPFPRRVMLDALEVRAQAHVWIQQAKAQNWIENRDVIYRMLLVKSNVFKQTLLGHQDRDGNLDGYHEGLVSTARSLPMPRFIWLIEVSYKNDWNPSEPASPPVIADIVLDSTSTKALRPDFLLIHVPGAVISQPVMGELMPSRLDEFPQDHPHPPFPNIPRP